MAFVACDYLKKVYGAKSECVKYATDLKCELFKHCEEYFPSKRKGQHKAPPLLPKPVSDIHKAGDMQ